MLTRVMYTGCSVAKWLIKAEWGLSWRTVLVGTVNPDSKRSKVFWSHHAAGIPPRKSLSQLKLVLNYNQYPERLFSSDSMSSSVGITTEDYADRVTSGLWRSGP